MKLKLGQRYITRDGLITSPLEHHPLSSYYCFKGQIGNFESTWDAEGFYSNKTDPWSGDLVSEASTLEQVLYAQ